MERHDTKRIMYVWMAPNIEFIHHIIKNLSSHIFLKARKRDITSPEIS